MEWILLLPVLIPIAGGCYLTIFRKRFSKRSVRTCTFCFALAAGLSVLAVILQGDCSLTLFPLISENFPIYFRTDGMAGLFAAVTAVMWLLSTWFSFAYMNHQDNETRYQIFSLFSLGAVLGVCLSGNLVTTYLFYELMTLMTFPLVLHEQTKEAVSAGMTYLFYSIAGAFLGLCGIFFLCRYADTADRAGGLLGYVPGGFLAEGTGYNVLPVVLFLMLLGLACKAGMFPLHGWLPKAHPVAPAPASALLSGNITKMGLLFSIRVIYYAAGPKYLSGTWVMDALLSLSLITVFLGSMLAYREKVMKKRLAYSTVSQVSYCLTGVYLLCETALTGALLHMVFHSIVKNLLFLSIGAVIYVTGRTRADELKGIGKKMPVTMRCFTVAGLALVGIPPLCGFVSKFYLATGALETDKPVFSYLVPAVLLISALLTAGYLLTVSADAFFGKCAETPDEKKADGTAASNAQGGNAEAESGAQDASKTHSDVTEKSIFLLAPLVILSVAAIVFGIVPNPLTDLIREFLKEIFTSVM